MNREIKLTLSDFISAKLKDISTATGISEEDLIKQYVFERVLQF